jgi:hypothetical protein
VREAGLRSHVPTTVFESLDRGSLLRLSSRLIHILHGGDGLSVNISGGEREGKFTVIPKTSPFDQREGGREESQNFLSHEERRE